MRYQTKGGALQMTPPPPPALPLSIVRTLGVLPPPPPSLPPEVVNTIRRSKSIKSSSAVASVSKNTKKSIVPGQPGVPIPVLGEDYTGRVNSTIDPAYDVYLGIYYADFSIRDKNGFLKLFRMFGNTASEVIQYISDFKASADIHGMMRAAEPITLNSIIRQLQTLKQQKQN